MKEIKRFNFNDVAAELGYVAVGGPGGPGGRPGRRPRWARRKAGRRSSEISHRPGIHPEKLSAVQDDVAR